MSLHVYLKQKNRVIKTGTWIYVRDNGKTRELSLDEAKQLYPDADVAEYEYESDTVFRANITHNLNTMAVEAGIYQHLWRPEELDIMLASQLIDPLREGLHRLKSDPERFRALNPKNGWGDYDGLVDFVEKYLNACYQYPDASVEADR